MKRVLLLLAFVVVPRMAAAQQAETIEYYGQDAIGSVRVVWDANGNVIGRQDLTPFGTPVQLAVSAPREGFAGQERDDETSQTYFHARMLQAHTGRFSAPDPIQDGVGEPQRWNRYAYALNNPIRWTDPTGLSTGCDETGCDFGCHYADDCRNGGSGGPGDTGIGGDDGCPASVGRNPCQEKEPRKPNPKPNPCTENPGAPGCTPPPPPKKDCDPTTGENCPPPNKDCDPKTGKNCPPPKPATSPSCSAGDAQVVRDASVAALQHLNPDQDESSNITPLNDNFAHVVDPAKITMKAWQSVTSSHGSSNQSPIIPGQNTFVVKFYVDPDLGNTIAVVNPTASFAHVWDFIQYEFGSNVNAQNARTYLLCPGS